MMKAHLIFIAIYYNVSTLFYALIVNNLDQLLLSSEFEPCGILPNLIYAEYKIINLTNNKPVDRSFLQWLIDFNIMSTCQLVNRVP